jgi:nucleotide-binding universal stress UspA family protein
MLKSLLALADGGSNTAATLRTATMAAGRFDAWLDVLHISPDAEPMAVFAAGEGMPMVGVAEETVRQAIKARRNAAKAAYDSVFGGASGGKVRWMEEEGRAIDLLIAAARLSDLVIISRPGDENDELFPGCVNTVLFETGKPALIAPPVPMPTIGTRIAVAWNDSNQAARAVSAALPFLAKATDVTILAAGTKEKTASATRLAAYLTRHGVSAKTDAFDPGSGSSRARGRALLQHAQGMNADLLVMGAYGQGRMMQFLGLGGATAKVITANTMPLLMAH